MYFSLILFYFVAFSIVYVIYILLVYHLLELKLCLATSIYFVQCTLFYNHSFLLDCPPACPPALPLSLIAFVALYSYEMRQHNNCRNSPRRTLHSLLACVPSAPFCNPFCGKRGKQTKQCVAAKATAKRTP